MSRSPLSYQESTVMFQQYSQELLEAMFQDEPIYPWNPSEPETEVYFVQLEQNMSFNPWSDDTEVEVQAVEFLNYLHQCWENPQVSRGSKALFAWLESISQQAQQLLNANLAPMDQLIKCVQPLLLGWAEEDLQVFARPFAYAMRGNSDNIIKSTLHAAENRSWETLSDIEQARLSLAIAHYAIHQFQSDTF
jgi:hypothetical protein